MPSRSPHPHTKNAANSAIHTASRKCQYAAQARTESKCSLSSRFLCAFHASIDNGTIPAHHVQRVNHNQRERNAIDTHP